MNCAFVCSCIEFECSAQVTQFRYVDIGQPSIEHTLSLKNSDTKTLPFIFLSSLSFLLFLTRTNVIYFLILVRFTVINFSIELD